MQTLNFTKIFFSSKFFLQKLLKKKEFISDLKMQDLIHSYCSIASLATKRCWPNNHWNESKIS